jgi:FAD/FMN-containing dehydrogenase
VNFLTDDEADDRVRAAYGSNYTRLAELKRRWDPDNFFRRNKNVAP